MSLDLAMLPCDVELEAWECWLGNKYLTIGHYWFCDMTKWICEYVESNCNCPCVVHLPKNVHFISLKKIENWTPLVQKWNVIQQPKSI